jgi:hypothetical protein
MPKRRLAFVALRGPAAAGAAAGPDGGHSPEPSSVRSGAGAVSVAASGAGAVEAAASGRGSGATSGTPGFAPLPSSARTASKSVGATEEA